MDLCNSMEPCIAGKVDSNLKEAQHACSPEIAIHSANTSLTRQDCFALGNVGSEKSLSEFVYFFGNCLVKTCQECGSELWEAAGR